MTPLLPSGDTSKDLCSVYFSTHVTPLFPEIFEIFTLQVEDITRIGTDILFGNFFQVFQSSSVSEQELESPPQHKLVEAFPQYIRQIKDLKFMLALNIIAHAFAHKEAGKENLSVENELSEIVKDVKNLNLHPSSHWETLGVMIFKRNEKSSERACYEDQAKKIVKELVVKIKQLTERLLENFIAELSLCPNVKIYPNRGIIIRVLVTEA